MDESAATDNRYESPQPPADATLRAHAELLEEYLRTTPDSLSHVLRPLAALDEVIAVCESIRGGRQAPQPPDRRSLRADVQRALTALGTTAGPRESHGSGSEWGFDADPDIGACFYSFELTRAPRPPPAGARLHSRNPGSGPGMEMMLLLRDDDGPNAAAAIPRRLLACDVKPRFGRSPAGLHQFEQEVISQEAAWQSI